MLQEEVKNENKNRICRDCKSCLVWSPLAVRHRLTLTLAKLTQHLKVNTVIAEFDFVEIRHDSAKCKQA